MDYRAEQKLGVLGGMGPKATQFFYQMVIDLTDAHADQEHLPMLILSDSLMPDRTQAILSGETAPVYERMIRDAQLLERGGCSAIAITCNTAHYFADRVQEEINIPIIHMLRETARYLADAGYKRPCILGTDGTIRSGLYQKECQAVGLTALAPEPDIQTLVMSIIYDEIKRGLPGSPEKFRRIDQAVQEMGCDCAILACTELSVFRTEYPMPACYVDAMEVLARQSILRCGKQLRKL